MIKELVKNNRTVRTFKDVKLSEELLRDLVEMARLSMCTRNSQALKYKIVNDAKDVEELHNASVFAGTLKDFNPTVNEGPKSYIIVYVDTDISNVINLAHVDSGIAMANMTLLAREKGFSSVIIGSFDKVRITKYFNLGDIYIPIYLVGLGEADEEVHIVDVVDNDIKYYREENNNYVPKRNLEDIIL
ncbi:nitroreductase family protein [Mycoplasmatota bacterium WC44]